jgi:hypothetical protein
MALYRSSTARPRRFAGQAKPLALALLAAGVLAGCGTGTGSDAGADAEAPTAIAGESMSLPTSKPIDVVGNAASGPLPVAAAASVPAVAGKVRYGVPVAAALGEGASLNGAVGEGASLNGAVPFPITDPWNREVAQAAVAAASDALIAALGAGLPLRAGFGTATGTPYVVIGTGQPGAAVRLAGSTEPRSWPIPADAPVSGAGGRVIVLDRAAGLLYELAGAVRAADGSWDAASGRAHRLDAADAAPADGAPLGAARDAGGSGSAVFPGLVRFDEAAAGAIRHALRITVPGPRDPASAAVPRSAPLVERDLAPLPAPAPIAVPDRLRLRLKASFEIPGGLGGPARTILQALKTYGAVVVVGGDGPAWSLDGAPNPAWDMASLAPELARVRGADLEVVVLERSVP